MQGQEANQAEIDDEQQPRQDAGPGKDKMDQLREESGQHAFIYRQTRERSGAHEEKGE